MTIQRFDVRSMDRAAGPPLEAAVEDRAQLGESLRVPAAFHRIAVAGDRPEGPPPVPPGSRWGRGADRVRHVVQILEAAAPPGCDVTVPPSSRVRIAATDCRASEPLVKSELKSMPWAMCSY
jgi:hypothetical protein